MPRVLLHITSPTGPIQHAWDPAAGPLTFGRSASADLSIISDTLSREHGRFEQPNPGPGLVVVDLGSRNGLKVNGRPVQQPTAVTDGDQISVGEVVIRLELQSDPTPPPPAGPAVSEDESGASKNLPEPPAVADSVTEPDTSHPPAPLAPPSTPPTTEGKIEPADGANWLELTETGDRSTNPQTSPGAESVPETAPYSKPVDASAQNVPTPRGDSPGDKVQDPVDPADTAGRGRGEVFEDHAVADDAAADGGVNDAGQSLIGEALPGLRSFEPTVTQEDAAARDAAPPPERQRVVDVPEGRLTLGRDPGCDAPLDSLLVSRHHAEVVRAGQDVRIRDLQSTNGTTVNGELIAQPAPLTAGDRVGIGPFRFVFDGRSLSCAPPQAGLEVRLQGITVKRRRRVLLDDVALTLEPGRVVGLVSDSAQTPRALADVLGDRCRPREGRVLFNGVDRSAYRRAFAATVGQARGLPAMFGSLRLREVMRTAARLRLSADVPRRELNAHLGRVLETVDLGYALKKRVGRLSADQRFRAGLAVQLLTQPQLVVVDTAGGEAGVDAAVWPTLRRLADAGTLVVWLTPNPASMRRCDRVVALMGGAVVADGRPDAVTKQLELEHWDDLPALASRRNDAGDAAAGWRERYLATAEGRDRDRAARAEADTFSPVPTRMRTPWSRRVREVLRQGRLLTGRWAARRWAERGWTLTDLLLPLALGAAAGGWIARGLIDPPTTAAIPTHSPLTQDPAQTIGATAAAFSATLWVAQQLLTPVVCLSLLLGVRSHLREVEVLRQERRNGLRLTGYLLGGAVPLVVESLATASLVVAGWWLTAGLTPRLAAGWWVVFTAVAVVGRLAGRAVGRGGSLLARGRGSGRGPLAGAAAWAWGVGLVAATAAGLNLWTLAHGGPGDHAAWWLPTAAGLEALSATTLDADAGRWWSPEVGWRLLQTAAQAVGWALLGWLLLLPRPRA